MVLRISHEVAVKLLTGAEDVRRFQLGWRIRFPSSLMWLLQEASVPHYRNLSVELLMAQKPASLILAALRESEQTRWKLQCLLLSQK